MSLLQHASWTRIPAGRPMRCGVSAVRCLLLNGLRHSSSSVLAGQAAPIAVARAWAPQSSRAAAVGLPARAAAMSTDAAVPDAKRARLEQESAAAAAAGCGAATADAAAAAAEAAGDASPGRRRRKVPSAKRTRSPSPDAAVSDQAPPAAAEAAAANGAAAAVQQPSTGEPQAASAAAGQQVQQQPGQQQETQQPPEQQQQQGKKKKKGKERPVGRFIHGLHQCIKRDLPHEALHMYRRIKQTDASAFSEAGTCSALLNVCVGKWQWELHQRHQHLARQYAAAGKDTAPLDELLGTIVAAAVAAKEQQVAAAAEAGEGGKYVQRTVLDTGSLPDGSRVPPELVCHVEKHIEAVSSGKLMEAAELEALLEGLPSERPPLLTLLADVSRLVMADLAAAGQAPDEQVFLQLARIAGISGDADKAFDVAKQLVAAWDGSGQKSAKLAPRLRDFQPALVGYALSGQADKAAQVAELMTQHCKLDLTESEYALWLEAVANGGSYAQLSELLALLAGELNELRHTSLDLVARFFSSDRASAVLAAGGPLAQLGCSSWKQQWVTPDEQGVVAEAGVTLQLNDLSDADWDAFAQQVRQLAEQQEAKTGKFASFIEWLGRHGPHELMIDGANVALWGENYEGGGFRPEKIRRMHDAVAARHPGVKLLLVLSTGRHHDIRANHRALADWLEELRKDGRYYVTPGGSNDDWYWMYAAVAARRKGLLVTNDLLRDHVWNLLRPKHMLKWTQRHIARYSFNFAKTEVHLDYPKPYTPCVQQLGDAAWLLPAAGGEGRWLCVQPE